MIFLWGHSRFSKNESYSSNHPLEPKDLTRFVTEWKLDESTIFSAASMTILRAGVPTGPPGKGGV